MNELKSKEEVLHLWGAKRLGNRAWRRSKEGLAYLLHCINNGTEPIQPGKDETWKP